MIALLHSLHYTIQANSKIAKQRIWTLNSRFASKQQNRERTDLDQSGHQHDCGTAFGIRQIQCDKKPKLISRVLQQKMSKMK